MALVAGNHALIYPAHFFEITRMCLELQSTEFLTFFNFFNPVHFVKQNSLFIVFLNMVTTQFSLAGGNFALKLSSGNINLGFFTPGHSDDAKGNLTNLNVSTHSVS